MAQTDTTRKKKERQAPTALVEFTAAAHEHSEPAFDVSLLLTAAQQNINPQDVPAMGYMRHLLLLVEASGGVGGTVAADGPFSVIKQVQILDVNGVAIHELSGYQLFLANLFGGYAFRQDPRLDPDYSASPTAFAFALRIPMEINHNNGLGAIANQNQAAPYRVRVSLAPIAEVYSVAPGTPPTVRVRGILEAWSQPNPTDLAGRPQALVPPRHGTTQYWSAINPGVAAGRSKVVVTRVGNLIRTLIFVARDGTGARSAAVFPDDATLVWDAFELDAAQPRFMRRKLMSERYICVDIPTGVFVWSYSHDMMGHAGDGTPELYLPTVQSSRVELRGNFAAGVVEVLTNEVAPVEVTPAERFMERSETGFHPDAVGGVTVQG